MDVLGTVLAFLLVLVVLVVAHEFGHFIVAKRAGITVQEFGIGFPPRIASFHWHGTRYSVNWIPLGGFVKMLGEDGEIEAEKMRERGLTEPQIETAMVGAFNRKPIWVRLSVLLAGVVMNVLLTVVLFAAALSLPVPVGIGPLTVTEIQPDSPAAAVDLRPGDVIVSADGQTFRESADLTAYVASQAGEPVELAVERDGSERSVTVTPRVLTDEERNQGLGPIGFSYEPAQRIDEPAPAANPLDAVAKGAVATAELAVQIPGGLVNAIGGILGLTPNAGDARGPIGIAQETGRVLEAPFVFQLYFVGLLSINLAVLNVLPFPPLDGGRVAVTLLEAVRRRKLSAEREALIYLTGFVVLIALVILISIQDISRLPGS
jgi:regulator of sigma E protease